MSTAPLAELLTLINVTPVTATRHRLALARRLLRDALGVLFQSEYHQIRDVRVTCATTRGTPC